MDRNDKPQTDSGADRRPPDKLSALEVKSSKLSRKAWLAAGGLAVVAAAAIMAALVFFTGPDVVDQVVEEVAGMSCERSEQKTGVDVPQFEIEFEGVIAHCSWGNHQYEVLTEQDFQDLYNTLTTLDRVPDGSLERGCANTTSISLLQAVWSETINAAVVEDRIFLANSPQAATRLLESLSDSDLDHQPFSIKYICDLILSADAGQPMEQGIKL